jgi:hypothetical protein
LKPSPKKYVPHNLLNNRNIYLACKYAGFEAEMLLHAKGAIACGGRATEKSPIIGCWTSDPYEGKK